MRSNSVHGSVLPILNLDCLLFKSCNNGFRAFFFCIPKQSKPERKLRAYDAKNPASTWHREFIAVTQNTIAKQ